MLVFMPCCQYAIRHFLSPIAVFPDAAATLSLLDCHCYTLPLLRWLMLYAMPLPLLMPLFFRHCRCFHYSYAYFAFAAAMVAIIDAAIAIFLMLMPPICHAISLLPRHTMPPLIFAIAIVTLATPATPLFSPLFTLF